MNDETYDLAIVGAGPAGLSAAVAAMDSGASVVLVDSGSRVGGQFWRHGSVGSASARGEGMHDWSTFTGLRARLFSGVDSGRITYHPRTQVWRASKEDSSFLLECSPVTEVTEGFGGALRARRLVVATGTFDRQIPIPGWDLPGVMAAGGVQAYIKVNGESPGERVVVSGTGPFLLSVADSVLRSGGRIMALCEANSPMRWAPEAASVLAVPGKMLEGAEYAATLARHRVGYRTRRVVTEILGTSRVEGAVIEELDGEGRTIPGTAETVDCDLVALGWGFTPIIDLAQMLGARTTVDLDGSLVVAADEDGATSVPDLYVAGEVSGVGGSAKAVTEGRIVGTAAARGVVVKRDEKKVARLRRFASSMHRAHPTPDHWQDGLHTDTTVCRCEEVTYGQLATAMNELGGTDPRSAKSFTRAGMGWCQGRECGFAVTCLTRTGAAEDFDQATLRAGNKRPMAAPIRLGDLIDESGTDDHDHSTTTEGRA